MGQHKVPERIIIPWSYERILGWVDGVRKFLSLKELRNLYTKMDHPLGNIKCEYQTPKINAQCLSMPLNADQNHGIDQKCLSLLIIADQSELIEVDRY